MKLTILAAFILLFPGIAFSQPASDKNPILKPINQLFAGMRAGDSAMVHGAFTPEVSFSSAFKASNGKPVLQPEPLADFLNAVGTPHAEVWSEMIWDVTVQEDDNFAQVWAKYAFYAGKKFSHCGIDAFHLFKGEDGSWKIFHLADTRRREGCEIPNAISNQFK